ncbi:MAG TPA: nucleoside monophosphate kinase, partial [Longimicrobiales bacterium]|nr:nucleoside monophosphate kinase [Longimicrobiales bacterium]
RHLSTGDLLRDHRRRGTDLGERARGFMDRGELVPDDLVLAMVRRELDGLRAEDGVVFDGFPRTVPQAEGLADVLEDVGREVDRVVVLEADDEVLVKRLAGRRSCPECGAVYNVHFNPPEEEDVCDRCGHRGLVYREDDEPETVRNRLQVYRRQTEPLIRFYEDARAPVVRVAGDQDVETVQRALRVAVGRPPEVVT